MNKKGLVADAIIDFFIYIGFLLLFLIFFGILSVTHSKFDFEMKSKVGYNDAQTALLTYLRTPVNVYNEDMTLADLISRATVDEKYRRIVRSEIQKVVSPQGKSFKNIQRYDFMVDFPAGTGIKKCHYPSSPYAWTNPAHDGSYYVGNLFVEDEVSKKTFTYGNDQRKQVAEIVIPNQNNELINITLYDSVDPKEKLYFSHQTLFWNCAYPGEIIEDSKGQKIVLWDYGDIIKVSLEGTPCNTKSVNENSKDTVKCLDNSVPDLLTYDTLERYIDDDIIYSSPTGTGSTTQDLSPLNNAKPGDVIPLELNGITQNWVCWGPSEIGKDTLYFATEDKSGDICRDLYPSLNGKYEVRDIRGAKMMLCSGVPTTYDIQTNIVIIKKIWEFETIDKLKKRYNVK